jgi:hypothetical protein
VILFACACGYSLTAPNESAGNKIKCPNCGKEMIVPAAVPAGPIDDETAALSRLLSPEASGERSKETATCDLNATIDQPGRAAREGSPQGSPLTTHRTPRPTDGPRLGGYRILRELGHGGMGVIYEAEDIELERCVSLKVMKPEIAKDAQHRERFLREASAAASVESVFICPIYEVCEHDGVPFIAMPFLKGEPLDAHWKKSQRLALDEVVRIGKEIAEGLSAAHEAGLVHRDIKPSNIWLETQPSGPPRAIILDFGLARVQADNAQITRSGVIVGTPAYMFPEQLNRVGARGALDEQAGRCPAAQPGHRTGCRRDHRRRPEPGRPLPGHRQRGRDDLPAAPRGGARGPAGAVTAVARAEDIACEIDDAGEHGHTSEKLRTWVPSTDLPEWLSYWIADRSVFGHVFSQVRTRTPGASAPRRV